MKLRKVLGGILLLGAGINAFALGGTTSGNVKVTVAVEKYAEIDVTDAAPESWYTIESSDDYSGLESGDGEVLDRLLNLKDREHANFSGASDEMRYSVVPVSLMANAACIIKMDVTPFVKADELDSVKNNKEALQDAADALKFQFTYSVGLYNTGAKNSANDSEYVVVKPMSGNSIKSGSFYLNPGLEGNGKNDYALVSAIQMPSSFWRVEAGEYASQVTLTIEGD